MEDIKNILSTATEDELLNLLKKFSEEKIIASLVKDSDINKLSQEEKEKAIVVTAQVIDNLFSQRTAEKRTMELDGFLRFLFMPNDKGDSNFIKLGDLNVQTAQIAAQEIGSVIESERRMMIDKLSSDLTDIQDYNINEERLNNMYQRYFEQIPDVTNVVESKEKNRKNKMLTEQKERRQDDLTTYNTETGTGRSQDLRGQIQALKQLRSKAEEQGDFKKVKEYNSQINSLAYRLRYQEPEDLIHGKKDSVDNVEVIINEAYEGMRSSLSAAKKYQARLQGKVNELNDIIYDDDDFLSGNISSEKKEQIRSDADDINKSLAYTYCAIFDYRLYELQYHENKNAEKDKLLNTEYLKIYEAYNYYSELFLDTYDKLNESGILKGFPISKEFIGRDLSSDIDEAKEKASKSRETYAAKAKKEIKDVPINYKYFTKLPQVESFLGKSEGKIIKNSPLQNEPLVDDKLKQYKDQMQIGDILSENEVKLREKIEKTKKLKEDSEKAGDSKKIEKYDTEIKKLYQQLDSISKGKGISSTQSQSIPTGTTKTTLDDLLGMNTSTQNEKSVELPETKDTLTQQGQNTLLTDDDLDALISETINKQSSESIVYKVAALDLAITDLHIRYANDELNALINEGYAVEGEIPSSTPVDQKEVQVEEKKLPSENKKEIKDLESKRKELVNEIQKRIREFEKKDILNKVVEIYTKAAEDYATIQEQVKSAISADDVTQAIEYYRQNRQKLRRAENLNLYEILKYASTETVQGIDEVLQAFKDAKNMYAKYRLTNGAGVIMLPVTEFTKQLEKSPVKALPGLKKAVESGIQELVGNNVIPKVIKGNLLTVLENLQSSLNKINFDELPAVSEISSGNQKVKGDDPLSKLSSVLYGFYKTAYKHVDNVGKTLGHFVKEDNTFYPVLFVYKVFGLKNTFVEQDGERKWTGLKSMGNSQVPNTVGGVDKLSFYKAIKLYPSFLGELQKMIDKTANEINDTPISGSAEDGQVLYGYSRSINNGIIDNLPGLYRVDHPNYNYKIQKSKK